MMILDDFRWNKKQNIFRLLFENIVRILFCDFFFFMDLLQSKIHFAPRNLVHPKILLEDEKFRAPFSFLSSDQCPRSLSIHSRGNSRRNSPRPSISASFNGSSISHARDRRCGRPSSSSLGLPSRKWNANDLCESWGERYTRSPRKNFSHGPS